MNKTKLLIAIILTATCIFGGYKTSEAKRKNYYRTFEIIRIDESGITLRDSDGNIIVADKDPEGYKPGYKVRYDSVRNRLKNYRWQDYTVMDVTRDSIILKHKTGDILSVKGSYSREFKIGDKVRYDIIDGKVHADDDSSQWQQYTVVAASSKQITIRSTLGQDIILQIDNNLYPDPRAASVPQYKVGDLVRYDIKNNKLKEEVRKSYDWQEYEIINVTRDTITLVNDKKDKIDLENTNGSKFKIGDQVKYDRLNKLLKKR